MKFKIYTLIIAVAALSFQACGEKKATGVEDNSKAVPVTVSKVAEGETDPFVAASGKISASNSANLSTRMMGFVDKVYVKVGQKVRKGQTLLRINNADLQAKLAQVNAKIIQAEAGYNNAEKDYNRFKNLYAQESASQKEMDDMTAHYNMAKAGLEAANQMKKEVMAQFSYTNIKAPFSGVVINKFVDAGDMANPGMPLVAVETPGNFEVTAMVPETEISNIEAGSKVKIHVKAIDRNCTGKVTEVSPSAKNTGGQYLVKVVLDKSDAPVLSGMFATVQFPVKNKVKSDMVLLPNSVLTHKGQLSGVYTVSSNNTAVLRWLRLGRKFGDQVEVLSGLSAEEAYIVSAEGKLYNGAKLSIQ